MDEYFESEQEQIDAAEYEQYLAEMSFYEAYCNATRMAESYPQDQKWSEAREFLSKYAPQVATA